jgi:hypothetical protein
MPSSANNAPLNTLIAAATTITALATFKLIRFRRTETSDQDSGSSFDYFQNKDIPVTHKGRRRMVEDGLPSLILIIEARDHEFCSLPIVRAAESLGILNVWIILPTEDRSTDEPLNNAKLRPETAPTDEHVNDSNRGLGKYRPITADIHKDTSQVNMSAVKTFHSFITCFRILRRKKYQIWATDFDHSAVAISREALSIDSGADKMANISNFDLVPNKLAIVFGDETRGCSSRLLADSDKRVFLPRRAFTDHPQSFTIALIVHQLININPTLIKSNFQKDKIKMWTSWYKRLSALERRVSPLHMLRSESSISLSAQESSESCPSLQLHQSSSDFQVQKPQQIADRIQRLEKSRSQLREKLQQTSDRLSQKMINNTQDCERAGVLRTKIGSLEMRLGRALERLHVKNENDSRDDDSSQESSMKGTQSFLRAVVGTPLSSIPESAHENKSRCSSNVDMDLRNQELSTEQIVIPSSPVIADMKKIRPIVAETDSTPSSNNIQKTITKVNNDDSKNGNLQLIIDDNILTRQRSHKNNIKPTSPDIKRMKSPTGVETDLEDIPTVIQQERPIFASQQSLRTLSRGNSFKARKSISYFK